MSGYKKQHYVAQGSLGRFAQDGEHFFVFDKVSGRVRPASVRDVVESYRTPSGSEGMLSSPHHASPNVDRISLQVNAASGRYRSRFCNRLLIPGSLS